MVDKSTPRAIWQFLFSSESNVVSLAAVAGARNLYPWRFLAAISAVCQAAFNPTSEETGLATGVAVKLT